ncbi:MAG: hypothetical protein FD167_2107 [bacterium]|nr:MAG: hypothetical protein FD167_2107 [bacterium]
MVNKPKTLAIDPGGKELGIAVLEDQQLLFYAVKPTKLRAHNQISFQHIKKLIQNFIITYEITALAIKEAPRSYINSREINKVASCIKKLAQSRNIPVFEYSPNAIRRSVCKNDKATRQQATNRLAIAYPELAQFEAKSDWRERYYGKIFTALALGLTCFDQLKTNN